MGERRRVLVPLPTGCTNSAPRTQECGCTLLSHLQDAVGRAPCSRPAPGTGETSPWCLAAGLALRADLACHVGGSVPAPGTWSRRVSPTLLPPPSPKTLFPTRVSLALLVTWAVTSDPGSCLNYQPLLETRVVTDGPRGNSRNAGPGCEQRPGSLSRLLAARNLSQAVAPPMESPPALSAV